MKVLITGGSGMVGRNLRENPGAEKHEILAPSSQELNLLDRDRVSDFMEAHAPDAVIHCAGAVGGIQANIDNMLRFLLDNLEMSKNLVTAARDAGVKRLINLGSSCMYPRNAPNPLKEASILTGELEPTNEGFALAKIVTQRLCAYIRKEDPSYQYKTVIPCNLYGRWDHFDLVSSHMIPAAIMKVDQALSSNSGQVGIWGSGEVRREFMYAGDLADFLWQCLDRIDQVPEIINVGLGSDHSINEFYQTIARVLGYEGGFDHDLSKPEGMKKKSLDLTGQEAFGWQSAISLEEGIRLTSEFYRERKGS